MAYQILGFICEESISCNIILLDRPRPSFSLDREDSAMPSDSKAKQECEENRKEGKKKTLNNRVNASDSEDELDDKEETHGEDENDEDGDDEDDPDKIKSLKSKFAKKKAGLGSESNQDSDLDSSSDSDSKHNNLKENGDDGDGIDDDDKKKKKRNDDEDRDDYDDGDDDEDEDYDDDYLAFKRETYRGRFESYLMDGRVKISYNTKKDERIERKKKMEMERVTTDDKGENAEGKPVDFKPSYHKSIEFEFDQFFFTIEHKQNKSIVKMIIFETESRCYEIKFRVDPELGRDNLYYTMIAFQGCYRNQNYNWDDHLRNGDISPIKELVQEELELLALKGYN